MIEARLPVLVRKQFRDRFVRYKLDLPINMNHISDSFRI